MKKYFNFALLSAIALTGTIGFTACSSSDDTVAEESKVENNPTYDPVAKTVTTQFVLNVSSAATTRQTAAAVQQNANFRGMKEAKLVGLSTGHNSWLAPYDGSTLTSDKVKFYDLGTLYGSTEVNNEGSNNSSSSSRRVLQLTLPLKTDAMLVYARAISGSATDGTNTDAGNGKVVITLNDDPSKITFDLVSRIGTKETEYTETCNLAALILNRILKSQEDAADSYSYSNTYGTKTNENPLPAISWRGIGKTLADGGSLPPLQENLAVVYNQITTFGTNEVRGGSAHAICSMIYNAYQVVLNTLSANATTDGELNAQRLAETIKARIDNYFNVSSTESGTAFRTLGTVEETHTIINGLVTVSHALTLEQYNTQFGHVVNGDLMGLPTSFNLPEGTSQLNFVAFNADASTGGFTYKNPSTSLLDLGKDIKASHYMYPSELLYFDNSALYVSDAEKQASEYPNGYSTWDGYSWVSNGWANASVSSTTRSVAVKNNINYGVAMLQTKVTLDGDVFADNRHTIIPEEADQSLTADEVKQFKLTGVLIGGQNDQVGWNYLAKDDDWNYVIYDSKIAGTGAIPTPSGEENYTLVFDNYMLGTSSSSGTQADQTNVLVALEFENQSKDFYGNGNMIRYGGKFYLVGKLTLGDNRIAESNWPTYYAIPPYSGGATNKISRVFIQDFMTTANFKIGANSLKNAYVTVPDLRSSQTSLGLSVDLQWQTGLSFESVLGGREE